MKIVDDTEKPKQQQVEVEDIHPTECFLDEGGYLFMRTNTIGDDENTGTVRVYRIYDGMITMMGKNTKVTPVDSEIHFRVNYKD